MTPAPRSKPAALVTGASYGIGAATALAFARAGYDLALCDLDPQTLAATESAARASGAQVVRIALDLRSQSSIEAAMTTAANACPELSVLVNNAGVTRPKPVVEVTRADWDAVMSVNLAGTFFMSQQVGRHWIRQGRPGTIISIASTHGIVGRAGQSVYGISKGGIVQMTRMLAIEWAGCGIRVNAIAPGKTDTDSPARQSAVATPERRAALLERIPLGRFGAADEVAALACYLASAEAAYMTGQIVALDGGLTAQ